MKSKVLISSLIVGAIVFAYACKKSEDATTPPSTVPTVSPKCSTDSIYFVNNIQPLLTGSCAMSGCHNAGTHAGNVNLTSYAEVAKHVVAKSAGTSLLYKEVLNDDMPLGGIPKLTATQKALIEKWINQGAKNNGCLQ